MDSKITIYRHKKRGTRYELLGIGKMQAEGWFDAKVIADALLGSGPPLGTDAPSVDMAEVAIYRSLDDGALWVRPKDEFFDGRFEATTEGDEPDDKARFDNADWYWRTMDPDDSGDNPAEALNVGMVGNFTVCEVASSFRGPTRYGFTAPVLDPESDDEEFLHFATQEEAMIAAGERFAAVKKRKKDGRNAVSRRRRLSGR